MLNGKCLVVTDDCWVSWWYCFRHFALLPVMKRCEAKFLQIPYLDCWKFRPLWEPQLHWPFGHSNLCSSSQVFFGQRIRFKRLLFAICKQIVFRLEKTQFRKKGVASFGVLYRVRTYFGGHKVRYKQHKRSLEMLGFEPSISRSW